MNVFILFYSFIGIIIAGAKGVLRCLLLDKKANFEAIPVDLAINGMIMIAKELGTLKNRKEEIPVYNITVHQDNRLTYGDLFEVIESMRFDYPFSFGLWFPNCAITTNKFYFMLNVILFQWIPAYFIDFLFFIFGQKRL